MVPLLLAAAVALVAVAALLGLGPGEAAHSFFMLAGLGVFIALLLWGIGQLTRR